ncbi:hypothetical protein BH23PLA1_BH23PLA1_03100 [soil metagenome]
MPDRLLHGCSTALKALIEAIDPRPDDTIVVLLILWFLEHAVAYYKKGVTGAARSAASRTS